MNYQKIKMLDLDYQDKNLNQEISEAIAKVIEEKNFIKGRQVSTFETDLAQYLGVQNVISCGNGTDALQLALMALKLPKDAEILVPTFAYIAAAEAVKLLGFRCKFLEADSNTFNIDTTLIESEITENTKAIIVVHLFGQSNDMLTIMKIAQKYNLFVIEDNAQSLGADYNWPDGSLKKLGTIGHIGTTSFFPSKNLGCFGDGGAVFTNDFDLAQSIRMIANHGQIVKYIHDEVGINSRLDTIQAALLSVKLKYYQNLLDARIQAALVYDSQLSKINNIEIPNRVLYSNHIFHQYTIKVKEGKRDSLKNYLEQKGVPTMVYYPHCIHQQKAYLELNPIKYKMAEHLSEQVLALPMHTELTPIQIEHIAKCIEAYPA